MQRAATVLAELVNVIDMSKNVTSMPMLIYSILCHEVTQKIDYSSILWWQSALFCAEKKNVGIRLKARCVAPYPYANCYYFDDYYFRTSLSSTSLRREMMHGWVWASSSAVQPLPFIHSTLQPRLSAGTMSFL